MTGTTPLRDKVVTWLAEQGYPLEMRVAAAFRQTDLCCRQSTHYIDSETGKSREIDVIGTQAEPLGMAVIHFVAECKAATKPWVLFTSPHTLENFNRLFALGILSEEARAALSEKIRDLPKSLLWFEKDGRIGYNLTEAFSNHADDAYGAANAVVKACLFLLRGNNSIHTPPLIFTFPTIIIGAPLYECFLGDDGQLNVAEIEQGWLFVDTHTPRPLSTCIRVIPLAALTRFATEIRDMKDSLQKLIADDVQRKWREFQEERNYPGDR
jgi:hypothetical protein